MQNSYNIHLDYSYDSCRIISIDDILPYLNTFDQNLTRKAKLNCDTTLFPSAQSYSYSFNPTENNSNISDDKLNKISKKDVPFQTFDIY